jgi:hypothetical protein
LKYLVLLLVQDVQLILRRSACRPEYAGSTFVNPARLRSQSDSTLRLKGLSPAIREFQRSSSQSGTANRSEERRSGKMDAVGRGRAVRNSCGVERQGHSAMKALPVCVRTRRVSASADGSWRMDREDWWTWSGSNRRPLPCHGSALPTAPQAHNTQKLFA